MSIRLAKKIAEANDNHPQWMLGAVLSRGGSVISVGWNKPKNDPSMDIPYAYLSIHAEADAIRQVYDATDCVLYVARKRRDGNFGLAKPCKHCQILIRENGIKKVIYTVDNETIAIWKPNC